MKHISISDFIFDDDAVILGDVLILSDTHLGRTEKQQYAYPEPEYDDIYERIKQLVTYHNPKTVVIAGDVFQKQSEVPLEAIQTLDKIHEFVDENGSELVLIPGNHDDGNIELSDVFDGVITQNYRYADDYGRKVVVLHGHKTPVITGDVFVMGHLHPVKRHHGRMEGCYLYSDNAYYDSAVLILPAFTNLISGSNVETMNFNPDLIPVLSDGKGMNAFTPVQTL